jgi:hypothetical protein
MGDSKVQDEKGRAFSLAGSFCILRLCMKQPKYGKCHHTAEHVEADIIKVGGGAEGEYHVMLKQT